jgi:hypothetical protein
MSDDTFRYDILAQEALRGVVRSVLRSVEKRGLPGEHHFVITFDTRAPGVSLSKRLLDRYSDEMTIVIQYQFWGLKVYESAFEIGLSFSNVPETLVIPFRAMKSFADPSVGFMLHFGQFDALEEAEPEADVIAPEDGVDASEPAPSADAALPGPGDTALLPSGESSAPAQGENGEDWQDNESADGKKGAEVVNLDAFRKK